MKPWALLWSFLLGACAPQDVCSRGEALSRSFPERHAECFAEGTLPDPSFDAGSCDDSMNACSQTDQAALQAYFECVESLPGCTAATRSAFNDQFLGCASGMGQLSEGCFRP